MEINGFKFYVIQTGSQIADRRYEARRDGIVLRSKSLEYLKRKVKKCS